MKKLFNFIVINLEKSVWLLYIIATTIFFLYLYKSAPRMAGDAYLYDELSTN